MAPDADAVTDAETHEPTGGGTAAETATATATEISDRIARQIAAELAAAAADPDDEEFWAPPEDCTDEELGRRPLTAEQRRAMRRGRRRTDRWRHLADDEPPTTIEVTPSRLGVLLRAARGRAGMNQREVAVAAGVPRSTVIRVEADAGEPTDLRVSTLVRLLAACELRLVVVDAEGTQLAEPYERERFHDGQGRRLPAHLALQRPEPACRANEYGAKRGPARVAVGRRRRRSHV